MCERGEEREGRGAGGVWNTGSGGRSGCSLRLHAVELLHPARSTTGGTPLAVPKPQPQLAHAKQEPNQCGAQQQRNEEVVCQLHKGQHLKIQFNIQIQMHLLFELRVDVGTYVGT